MSFERSTTLTEVEKGNAIEDAKDKIAELNTKFSDFNENLAYHDFLDKLNGLKTNIPEESKIENIRFILSISQTPEAQYANSIIGRQEIDNGIIRKELIPLVQQKNSIKAEIAAIDPNLDRASVEKIVISKNDEIAEIDHKIRSFAGTRAYGYFIFNYDEMGNLIPNRHP